MGRFATAVLALMLSPVWVEFGGSGTGGGVSATPSQSSTSPSLAMDSQGRPWLAWEELNFDGKWIYLRRWTGSAWEGVGGSDIGSGLSAPGAGGNEAPSLVLDSSDRPVVAWTRNLGVGVARWTGTTWSAYPQPFTWPDDHGSAFSVKVRVDANDRPVVLWSFHSIVTGNESIPSQVYLKRWTGSAWEELGGSASDTGISNATYFAERPDLALDAAGNPIVTWSQCDSAGNGVFILVKRWNGTSWVGYGGSSAIPGISGTNPQAPRFMAIYPSIATDLAGNPIVAWHDVSVSMPYGEIFLRKWDGTAWVELGGSATGGGVSAAGGANVGYPSLKVGPTGFPTVAWQNGPLFETDEIYVKRWNGGAWVERAGSATGGGVSATGTVSSSLASLALTPAGVPAVAWTEGLSNLQPSAPEIYYRQFGDLPYPILAVTAVVPAPGAVLQEPPPELKILLTEFPDPVTVNGVSVVLTGPGKDRILGTADDVEVPAAISVAGSQITVNLRDLKLPKGDYRLRLRGTEGFGPGGAVRGGSGQLLDGEFSGAFPSGDGTSGGDFVVDLFFGKAPPGQR